MLADVEVVPCIETSLAYAKEVRDACLAADIPVLLWRGEKCATLGCAPRVQILAREEDLPRITSLLHDRWRELAEREGTVLFSSSSGASPTATPPPPHAEAQSDDDDGPLPCPACGAAVSPTDRECPDCGLALE
ncbi:MAG: hypothetical protein V2A73_23045 [Pseudomonadota bacterium]